MSFDSGGALSGLGGLLGGIFGHPEKPYDAAQNEYDKWTSKGEGVQKPYQDAGVGALGNYQDWLNGQKDPTKFINDTMNDYQESPYAQYLQKQSLRAGQNAASAGGLSGSTPLVQQMQQNAGAIASKDQNTWLQDVLGINKQYGEGQNNLVQGGHQAANALTDLYSHMGDKSGENAYNREGAKQNNMWNTIGSGIGLVGSFL